MTQFKSPVEACLHFFEKAVPAPTAQNRSTQLGVHLEEVVEMLDELEGQSIRSIDLIDRARFCLHGLAEYLKANPGEIKIKDRVKFIDAICDQMVTGIGTAYMNDMDVAGAFDEVNRSNLSKFGENGEPIFNENGKIMKGPIYSPAELELFV